ncbi:MAG: arylamine N-acetyltransferase [Candidatus Eisenbacteria sp.]|nr:arylamine N-acetyltransferase [Candidatus Eisenbacteria bacterium]
MPTRVLQPARSDIWQEANDLFFKHFRLDPSARGPLFLQQLVSSFGRLPYENLSKIIRSREEKDPVDWFRLPAEVMKDHVEHRLGGTCFSLTFFLERLLICTGFNCYKVMAHMRAGENIHCAAIVRLPEGDVLIDPGYGLNRPVALSKDRPVRFVSRHGGVELVFDPEDERFHLFTYMAQERKWRYCFTNEPVSDEEFERHWIASFSKSSMSNVCLYRASHHGHLYLRKNHLRITSFRGQRKENVRESLDKTVETYFGIAPHWVEEARGILAERRAAWQKRNGENDSSWEGAFS